MEINGHNNYWHLRFTRRRAISTQPASTTEHLIFSAEFRLKKINN